MPTRESLERGEVKKFFGRVLIFLTPILGILAFPLFVFIMAREYVSPDIFATPTHNIVGFAYSNPVTYYKARAVQQRRPRVIALGSSRVLTFRDKFFNTPETFFNAGNSVGTIHAFQQFLDQIPKEDQPSIIIIGLDQNFFIDTWDTAQAKTGATTYTTHTSPENIFLTSWLTIYRDYATDKFSLYSLFDPKRRKNNIGLRAFVSGEGFSPDGAYNFGSFFKNPLANEPDGQKKFVEDIHNVLSGKGRYSAAESVSTSSLSELALFLDTAAARNIHVVGFIPPIAPSVYEALSMHERIFLRDLPLALAPIFSRHGLVFVDFSDSAPFGISDAEMIDEAHGSDKAYLRIFLKLCEQDAQLASVSAPLDGLQLLLKNSRDSYHVIPGETTSF